MARQPRLLALKRPYQEALLTQGEGCTYRSRALAPGTYLVVCSNWPAQRCPDCPHFALEVVRSEIVNLYTLTDAEAQLAGVPSAQELQGRLADWYGAGAVIYRNWLRLLT